MRLPVVGPAAAASVLLTVLLVPSSASASLVLLFDPPAGPPGTSVNAHSVSEGEFNPVPAPADFPTMFVKAGGQRVVLGRLKVNATGYASITFRVPDIPPGSYTVWAKFTDRYHQAVMEKCPTCTPSLEHGGGQFVVEAPAGGVCPGSLVGFLAGVVATLVVIGGVVLARMVRRR